MIFSKASELLFTILFADDTNIFIEGISYNKIILEMNTEIFKIETLLATNIVTLNVNKTHYIIFHRSLLIANHCDVILNDDIVKRMISIKFLGIFLDEKQIWKQQIEYVKTKFLNLLESFI